MPAGTGIDEPRRHVDEIAGEAVDMKAHDAGDIFAEIVASLAAGLAGSAGQSAISDHRVADAKAGDAGADRADFAGGFGADHQRQLALGECHAAPAPDVDVIKPDGLDADLHLARRGRGRRSHVEQLDLAIGDKRERAHGVRGNRCWLIDQSHAGSSATTRDTFWPPKPNELEIARRTFASRATLGTTSSWIAGSGMA